MPILRVENVDRSFKVFSETVYALKKINLSIMPGKLTVLRGRSGSGKTTLLNLLGALDKPSFGHIYYNDLDLSGFSKGKLDDLRRREMGFVFQSIALISIMTALENVEFGLRIAGYKTDFMRERAEECLDFVGMRKRMWHRINELSGGEQQRVAIARAIAHKPRILFADEPSAELDTHMGLQVMKLFRDLVEKDKITMVMTSHDPNIIELADYVYELQDGEITDYSASNNVG